MLTDTGAGWDTSHGLRPVCKRHWLHNVCSWWWGLHSGTHLMTLTAVYPFSSASQPNSLSFQLPTCQLQALLQFNWMCYFLKGGMGEKETGGCPWRTKIPNACLHDTHCQRQMGDASSILEECNHLNWPSFRLKPMDAQWMHNQYFLWYFFFYLLLPKTEINPEGINWGLCSSEEEIRVRVAHFLIKKKKILFWSWNFSFL